MSLTGILLDVSVSMEENIGSGTDEEKGPWARSIFKVIDDLIEHDVSSDNQVFAIGLGANCSKQIFDVIGTVQKIEKHEMPPYAKNMPATKHHINEILDILERNGARNIRKWVNNVEIIQDVPVTDYMAAWILMKFESDAQFLTKFVNEFLPSACQESGFVGRQLDFLPFFSSYVKPAVEGVIATAGSHFRPATTEDIHNVVDKAKCHFLKDIGTHSTFSVKDASRIIRGCVDEEELTTERSRELLDNVEPFIYGRTPLYESLKKATEIFVETKCSDKKLLFVLSDGDPTDSNNHNTGEIISKLREAKFKVVSCFITKSTSIQPKRLYDQIPPEWEPGAKFLFSLSSELPTQLLPRAILLKRHWNIDIANNETKLFIQVNHPDNLREACKMAKDVVSCAEALSDLLVSIDLDLYINQSNKKFRIREKQVEGTCYANASAAVLHLAMGRILGRAGGYPDFKVLRKEMIKSFGNNGAYIDEVLQQICPNYRLRWKKLDDVKEAMEAIIEKRPVIATFYLTYTCECCGNEDSGWKHFEDFFEKNNGKGILTMEDLFVRNPCPNAPLGGHVVVLTSYNSKCLTLMNTEGSQWGDMGFFRVKDAKVLEMEFFDVYWTEDDLHTSEKEYHKKHGSEVARKLMTSLKGLQAGEYTCPECGQSSAVTEFTGTLSKVKCPKCWKQFSTINNEGNILALNLYLTSCFE